MTGEPGPLTRRYVRWALRHGRALWIAALVLAVPAALRTASLYANLRSSLDELLPRDAPSVVAIDELRRRMPGLQYFGVILDVGDASHLAAGERMLDDLAARVRTYPPSLVRRVRTGIADERAFFERHAPVYADLADLREIRSRVEARRDWEATRAMGADLDDDEPAPSVDFSDLEKRHEADRTSYARFDGDRFSSAGKRLTLLLIEVGSYDTGSDVSGPLFARVEADLRALGGPGAYAPGMRVGFTGDVAINVEELSALVADLTVSTFVVVFAVLAVILAYFRWWPAVPVLAIPLFASTLYAFALVTLPPASIDALNSNTAFLGSVIVGNGVNFGIIFLARYVEERRHGRSVEDSLVAGVWGTRTGTFVAAAAAATAYGSLVLTRFRGFRQFGVIGGVGMLVCWSVAFLLTPSLVALFDRGEKRAPRPVRAGAGVMVHVARLVRAWPRALTAVAAAVTVLALVASRKLGPERIEYDFSRLRRSDTHVSGEGYWGKRMDGLLGRYLSPLVALCDDPAQMREVAAALREAGKQPAIDALVQSVQTIDDVVPREQAAKLVEARAIRADLTPRIRAALTDDARKTVDRYLTEASLVPVRAADVPATLTAGMLEHDGALDRAVLVYPRPTAETWNGSALMGVTRDLRATLAAHPSASGKPARLAGSFPLSADIIQSIARDGPLATAVALAGVILVVGAVFRASATTALIVGSLLLGVLWLAAATVGLDIKINFCNFIAFPITFGIGVDYSVNVMARYVQSGAAHTGDITRAVQSTGGAVGLCSMTTIIGYGSLLFAQNQALFSFGVVAILGEIACLTTAVVVLPALLLATSRAAAIRPSEAS